MLNGKNFIVDQNDFVCHTQVHSQQSLDYRVPPKRDRSHVEFIRLDERKEPGYLMSEFESTLSSVSFITFSYNIACEYQENAQR